MSKKKVSKVVAKKKTASKPAAKAVRKAATKPSKKVAPTPKVKAAGKQPVKVIAAKKEVEKIKADKPVPPKKEENTGDTLIEMAKAEMAAVKIGQTAEKVEKASKFKAIKVERGNAADEKAKWQELYKRYGKEKAITYKMTDIFEPLKPMQHKVLGWGFILTNENDRLEVLFENGIKMLISNYKPN